MLGLVAESRFIVCLISRILICCSRKLLFWLDELFFNKFVAIIYLVGVLLLILPSFIKTHKHLREFIQNIAIWVAIILVLLSLILFFNIL